MWTHALLSCSTKPELLQTHLTLHLTQYWTITSLKVYFFVLPHVLFMPRGKKRAGKEIDACCFAYTCTNIGLERQKRLEVEGEIWRT